MDTNDIIICRCGSVEHQIIVSTVDNPYETDPEVKDEVYISIHLVNRSFWRRLKYGIKYIFGRKSNYGAWDSIITSREKIKEIANKL